jgi:hypothetical protein
MATKVTTIKRRPRVLSENVHKVFTYRTGLNSAELLTQVAYFIFAAIEGLLVFRFILRLVGASPFNEIVSWVYNTTSLLVLPFQSILPNPTSDGAALEISTILAIVGYLVLFYLVVALFRTFVHEEQGVETD